MNIINEPSDAVAASIQRQLQPLFSASAAIVVLKDSEVGELEMPELRHRIIFNPVRRQAFIAGRVAARTALKAMGLEPEPIPALPSQAPQWPQGVVGSITHARGYTAVVVERHAMVQGLGVDLQDIRNVREGLLERISTAEETASLRLACRSQPEIAPLVAFAAKEAVFKALPAEMQTGLSIAQIRIAIPGFGRFKLESVADQAPPAGQLVGRFSVGQDYVAAGFSILADGAID